MCVGTINKCFQIPPHSPQWAQFPICRNPVEFHQLTLYPIIGWAFWSFLAKVLSANLLTHSSALSQPRAVRGPLLACFSLAQPEVCGLLLVVSSPWERGGVQEGPDRPRSSKKAHCKSHDAFESLDVTFSQEIQKEPCDKVLLSWRVSLCSWAKFNQI